MTTHSSFVPRDFERSVFVNCPFDPRYKPLLNAIVFCIVYLDFVPRVASERVDSGETRIDKIVELIAASRFGIHDLSRSQSSEANEIARHNMLLELGIDLGCRRFGERHHRRKVHLVLEEKAFRHVAAISDLAGCDPVIHSGKAKKALSAVRDFLEPHANLTVPGATQIWDAFTDFGAGLHLDLSGRGFSKAEIKQLRMSEYIASVQRWRTA